MQDGPNDLKKRKFSIKIKGTAIYSEEATPGKEVRNLDDFVVSLFEKYRRILQQEFEAAGELGYDQPDEKTQMIKDPYLKSFSFDTVSKDVQA